MSKNIDWSNLGFGYMETDKRFVSNYKDGAWDEGVMTTDSTVTISECAGVLLIMLSIIYKKMMVLMIMIRLIK